MARPKIRAGLPPTSLKDDVSRERWTFLWPLLEQRDGRRLDREKLATYCQVYARWKQAEDGLAQAGQLVASETGRISASPLVSLARDAARQVRLLEKQLRIDTLQAEPDDAPTGDLVNRRDLAIRLKVHMQTITKWEREGLPIAERGRRGRSSLYSESAVRAWLQAREDTATKDAGGINVNAERARRERAQAILAEQTHAMRARRLLPIEDVERVWAAEVAAVRAIVLASYTTHADRVHRAATLEGLAGVERALKELAYEVLRELANPDREIARAS